MGAAGARKQTRIKAEIKAESMPESAAANQWRRGEGNGRQCIDDRIIRLAPGGMPSEICGDQSGAEP